MIIVYQAVLLIQTMAPEPMSAEKIIVFSRRTNDQRVVGGGGTGGTFGVDLPSITLHRHEQLTIHAASASLTEAQARLVRPCMEVAKTKLPTLSGTTLEARQLVERSLGKYRAMLSKCVRLDGGNDPKFAVSVGSSDAWLPLAQPG